jgi:TM2 domain-containing membrane protein YozV
MNKTLTAHTTMILSWLLGYLGADRFYRGQIGWGILKMVTLGAGGIWWLVDAAYWTYKAGEIARN